MQNLLAQMELGTGQQVFRFIMLLAALAGVILVYAGTQFTGLRDREPMDIAQLARNVSRGEGYVTRFLRPVGLGHLKRHDAAPVNVTTMTHPELWRPPVYPWILGQVFRVFQPELTPSKGSSIAPGDQLMMILNWVWFALGWLVTYLLARELFDKRVAVFSCVLYLLCDPLLDTVVRGLPHNFLALLFLITVWAGVLAERWQQAGRKPAWVSGAVVVAALTASVGMLTHYAFIAVMVGLLVYVALAFPQRRAVMVGLCLAVYIVVLTPWLIRNQRVSDTWFGLAWYELYEGTGAGSIREIKPNQLQRTYAPDLTEFQYWFLIRQSLVQWRQMLERQVHDFGAGFVAAFLIVGLLHRFRRDAARRVRWLLVVSLISAVFWLGVTDPPPNNFLTVFAPVAIIFAVAFFYVLFERLQIRQRLARVAVISGFAVINGLPLMFTLFPPAAPAPYPPYDGKNARKLGQAFPKDSLLMSDIPWAVAWYGDRACVWTPITEADYITINDDVKRVAGIYITQVTLDEFDGQELIAAVIGGKPIFWLRGFPLLGSPPGFPLQVRTPVTRDGSQFLFSSGDRLDLN